MSNAEEIVNKIINEQNKPKSLRIGRKGEVARFSRMIEQYVDEMKSETLQELKERVVKRKELQVDKNALASSHVKYMKKEELNFVIETIEDMRDELRES